jgi:anti-anti-sigma factor
VTLATAIEHTGRWRVIRIEGELTRATVSRFQADLRTYDPAAGQLVIDLSGLSFIDSSGVSALVDLALRCGRARRMGIVAPSRELRRKLEVMSLRRAFVFKPDMVSLETALELEPGAPTA